MSIVTWRDPNRRPGFYKLTDIYDPDVEPQNPNQQMIIPEVTSLVINETGSLFYVTVLNPSTYKVTLQPATLVVSDQNAAVQVSVVDYGNNAFRIFTDTRNTPTRLVPSTRLIAYGNTATYQLFKNYGEENQTVVSRYYNSSGEFVSTHVPMQQVLTEEGQNSNVSYGVSCHTLVDLPEGTRLTMAIYSSHGALVALVTTFTKASAIMNEAPGYQPLITGLRIDGTQIRENGDFFLYENQDSDSLNLQVYVTYDDGNEELAVVDNEKTFIYGLEDFVSSWPGLAQDLVIKYYLSEGELTEENLTETSFIETTVRLIVVPNDVGFGAKIAVLPYWSSGLARYVLRYFLYTTDRDAVVDITPHVTIAAGTFVGTLYGVYQSLTLNVDLNDVAPDSYPESTIHVQTLNIRLQPQAALERYMFRDAPNSPTIYGTDSVSSRRPVIHYDADLEKYFVPSTIFTTEEGFINSFYNKAQAPYDAEAEEGPPVPTHFVIRDISSSAMVVATPIPIEEYDSAWAVTGTPKDRFAGATVVVEFLYEVSEAEMLILIGAPVDVYVSETGYLG